MFNTLQNLHKSEELQLAIKNKKLLKEERAAHLHNFFTVVNSINQAINARQTSVEIPTYNQYTTQFVELLRELKLIYNYELKSATPTVDATEGRPHLQHSSLILYFKMQSEGVSLLKYIQLISRPSYRKYINHFQLKKLQKYSLYSTFPYLILSNSEHGLLTHLTALRHKVGGQVLAKLHLTKYNP